ncbi:hypothetical protein [Cryobacterium shii]|uniref:hypothetical protein n=1 Tax=Cryobacterium shii TaxID=1259235 RepID=UPI0015D19D1E|nr:hypothetical protein [Cryobacterium shii]
MTRALLTLSALVLLGGPALAGCAPTPTPKPSATATTDAPVFASDADALAAATEAYAAYLGVTDAVLSAGGGDAAQLAAVAVGDALTAEINTAGMYAERKYRSIGSSQFDSVQIQSLDDDGQGSATVTAYLCSDISAVDVVDEAGVSVVPVDRGARFPLEITFRNSRAHSSQLLVASSEIWAGTDFC